MIAIVDTGGANLRSIMACLDRLGRSWQLTRDPGVISAAAHVILPGVGAARPAMARLVEAGLEEPLRRLTVPTLGICLGMQLLFEASEEGDTPCLGVIPGRVVRLAGGPGLSVPHMGWNEVTGCSALLDGIEERHFYFVHSFRAPLGPWVEAAADHGETVPALVRHGNFYGAQFHPERSGASGAQLFENFLRL